MDFFAQKNSIRLSMLEKRSLLSNSETIKLGVEITKRLAQLPEIAGATRIGIYFAFGNEVPTLMLFQKLRKKSGEIFFPRIDHAKEVLEFAQVDHEGQLQKGYMGISEPDPALPNVETSILEVMLVPGVAFDRLGRRVGWGKGYYDKTLAGFEGCKIGLAYDFQVVETIPAAPHDQMVDMIVTEKEVIFCQKNRTKKN